MIIGFDYRKPSIFEALDELDDGAYCSNETHEIINRGDHYLLPFLLSKV